MTHAEEIMRAVANLVKQKDKNISIGFAKLSHVRRNIGQLALAYYALAQARVAKYL